ncbi:MAG: hypothetical protein JSS83_05510 [Cyanobacteria bacterium SZAS LIN-3]|nr:hypothetical protein [Cyanobacteria bacterium SZAS LIN-3]MBS2009430.1 hypothetical protein [Cyanobacteria bacterium SZAS TMP-1]
MLKKKPHEVKTYSDTSREAELVQLEILRRKSPAEKLQMVNSLNNTMRTLMLSGIALRHPEFNEEQRRRKLMDQLLGEALAKEVYGPPAYPLVKGPHFENKLSDE